MCAVDKGCSGRVAYPRAVGASSHEAAALKGLKANDTVVGFALFGLCDKRLEAQDQRCAHLLELEVILLLSVAQRGPTHLESSTRGSR